MVSLRTIFLIIRGEYMAGAALRIAKKDIMSLTKAEQANIRASQQMAHYAVFAGGAMIAFGGMVMMGLMKMMEKYGQSSRVMIQFNRVMNTAMSNLAKGLIPVIQALTPFVKLLGKILEIPFVAQLVGWGVVFMIVAGGVIFLGGTILTLIQWLGLLTGSTKLATLGTSLFGKTMAGTTGHMYAYMATTNELVLTTKTATGATMGLATALGIVTAGFTIFMILGAIIGSRAGAIVAGLTAITFAVLALAVAFNILSVGALTAGQLAAFAVGAGLAAGVMAMQSLSEYQQGTSFVGKGGLAVLHGGEEIKSARESTAMSKIEKERRGVEAPSYKRTTWHVPITIENVHTKSDVEDLGTKIRRALKDALDKKV